MTGATFQGTVVGDSDFSGALAMVLDFEGAALYNVQFIDTNLAGSIFNNAILQNVNFENALLLSLDLQNTVVFDAGFLDRLERQGEANSFKRQRWQIQAISIQDLETYPQFSEMSIYAPQDGWSRQAYRITRNPDFKQQKPGQAE